LITAGDMAIRATSSTQANATPLRERILLVVLYVTVLASSVAVIEPSPHDALMGILAITCVVAGVRFQRMLVLPLLLLLVWNVAGMMALINVVSEEKTIQYTATSVYLAVAALMFATLFGQNTMPRLATMSAAYVLTATLVSLASIVGYFHLFPGAYERFTMEGRALGGFKDPNVFGPFLIWPALILLERMVACHFRLLDVMTVGTILFGLLLSFSRGAWLHFAVSCTVMLALALLTAPTQRARLRILALSAIGTVTLAALLAILLSFDSIGTMFQNRAQIFQSYDIGGQGSRFQLQELALVDVLTFPIGMGPFEFARVHGLQQQHNVYLQSFIVYGWFGGMAYVLLLLATLFVGFRAAIVRSPWQPYIVVAFATFVGEVVEGFVIDTDHWRHFFLMLGMIWGLAAATSNHMHGKEYRRLSR